ncbi:MAG: ribonuclease R [Alphaproteobacteria bacterium]|nr:ribonuclease R [Alphaproteobacteria bacterium]
MAAKQKKAAPLPTREQILQFLADNPGPEGKREIVRAFRLKGSQRAALRRMLRDLEADEGLFERGSGTQAGKDALPPVAVLEIFEVDMDGELIARPVEWRGRGPAPRIVMVPDRRGRLAAGIGERMLTRIEAGEEGYEGRVIRRISAAPDRVLGVFRESREGGRIEPTDRRFRHELAVSSADQNGARPGDLVLAEVMPGRTLGLRRARISERLGGAGEPGAISLIALHSHDIPIVLPADAIAEAELARPVSLNRRVDLRDLPLVTIDGADARDFDDAVWAAHDETKANKGGWRITVAIADVAHYVRPGSALDRAAGERGNSVYFPDRVVPMLPEVLSNGLCSLRPGEDRGCLACHMRIDSGGNVLSHRFERGVIRSAARLTYSQAQDAFEGQPDDTTKPLLKTVLRSLFGAYGALAKARAKRQTLELDLPERRITLGEDGKVARIAVRPRLESHKLIEEFMIAANVAAAETLKKRRAPGLYRIHDGPDTEKLEALRDFVESLGYALGRGQVVKPAHLNRLLAKVAGTPHERMVNQLVLRSQSQALYSPDNIGHFGLALARYAHFTSPIRRYADLIVHRALIGALGLGKDGIGRDDQPALAGIAEHISSTERRAAVAERDANDRFTAAFLAERVGAEFSGVINGVTRFGLFITLDETGADGLAPISSLPDDFYVHDEAHHRLVGRRKRRVYSLGEAVEIRLAEANAVTGGLIFELLGGGEPGAGRGAGVRPKAQLAKRGKAKTAKRLKPKTARKGKRRVGSKRR